jgi:hypothetical protein
VPHVPDQQQPNEDGLAPPLKTLRKRLNGVYHAEVFSGPTRKYVVIVAMMVGLASLPTLAAITAGSKEIDDGSAGAIEVPFLPFLPLPSIGAAIPARPGPAAAPAAHGQADDHQTRSRPSTSDSKAVVQQSHDSRYGRSKAPSHTGGHRAAPPAPVSPRDGARHRHPMPPDPEEAPPLIEVPEHRSHPDWSGRQHCAHSNRRARFAEQGSDHRDPRRFSERGSDDQDRGDKGSGAHHWDRNSRGSDRGSDSETADDGGR